MFEFKFLYKYSSNICGDQRLQRIFCRGSSEKESVDVNHNLMVFFIHSKNIYSWANSTTREEDNQKLKAVDKPPMALEHPTSKIALTHQKKIFNNNS